MPGVVAVFTGADMAADGMAPMRPLWAVRSRDGKPMAEPPRFALARGTVRHVGEPVVAVIARDAARRRTDAAERVEVDYEPLPAVIDARAAQAAGAPQLHEAAPGNVCFRWARGDEAAVRAAFASAAHVVATRSRQQPPDRRGDRAARGDRHRRAGRQQAHALQRRRRCRITSAARSPSSSACPRARMRVIAPDVGGGFGYKGKHLSRGGDRRLGGAAAAAAGEMGRDPQPKASSPTTRAAIT